MICYRDDSSLLLPPSHSSLTPFVFVLSSSAPPRSRSISMLLTGRSSRALFCCSGSGSCNPPGSRCRHVPSAGFSKSELLLAAAHQPGPTLCFATSAPPPPGQAELSAPFFSSCTWWLRFYSSLAFSPACTGRCRCSQQNRGCRCKGGCSLTCHSPQARASTLPWEKTPMDNDGKDGWDVEVPVVGKGSCWGDGGNLLQNPCPHPPAGTALWSGRRGSTAGMGSSSGPAVGQPCSACMSSRSSSRCRSLR